MLWYFVEAILERPQLDDVAGLVETLELPPELAGTVSDAWLREARARLALSRGPSETAIEDLRIAGRVHSLLHTGNPNTCGWRSHLALALAPTDPDEASRLAAEELELARAVGLPRAEGVALRTAGMLEGGEPGVALLRESQATLERSPAELERARTLVELGAALRRANHRTEARDPLRSGLDLAQRCGAERLAARAEEELRSSGAKPRGRRFSGLDSLTPSEARVARMAAEGLSNKEIAQALFVTAKTVENQLGRTYHKLGISGRDALPGALKT
jgi:DNA-binding CsgD family transcriptional regulator